MNGDGPAGPLRGQDSRTPTSKSGVGAQGSVGTTFGTACGAVAVMLMRERLPGLDVGDALAISALVAIPASYVGTVLSVILTAATRALVRKLGGNPDDLQGGA